MPNPPEQARVEEILERAASFYEGVLWESSDGQAVRSRLSPLGIEEQGLRDFAVGYAPRRGTELIEQRSRSGYSGSELVAAVIAIESGRGHVHLHFRSRIMFPVRDREGRILGFAGLATHSGPSWPQWVTSPETGRYRRGASLFGIDRAAPGIARSGRAIASTTASMCCDCTSKATRKPSPRSAPT